MGMLLRQHRSKGKAKHAEPESDKPKAEKPDAAKQDKPKAGKADGK